MKALRVITESYRDSYLNAADNSNDGAKVTVFLVTLEQQCSSVRFLGHTQLLRWTKLQKCPENWLSHILCEGQIERRLVSPSALESERAKVRSRG